jgi:diaminopimelate decarboxylase
VSGVLQAMIESSLLASGTDEAQPATPDIESLAAAAEAAAASKLAVIYDMDALHAAFADVKSAFPDHFVHCLAIKCAPLAFVTREAVAAGLGVEAASFGEATLALASGCPPDRIPFDSPAKTVAELRWALEAGLAINADSLAELERIDAIVKARTQPSASVVGLRVRPVIEGNSEARYAVSRADSKFGHPIHAAEGRADAVDAFRRYPWLRALHCHVGSVGCSIDMLARGAAELVALADEVDAALGDGRVAALDIGGGLGVSLASDAVAPTFSEYAAALRGAAPSLFERMDRRVYTEFGRALMMKSGWIVAQVEHSVA